MLLGKMGLASLLLVAAVAFADDRAKREETLVLEPGAGRPGTMVLATGRGLRGARDSISVLASGTKCLLLETGEGYVRFFMPLQGEWSSGPVAIRILDGEGTAWVSSFQLDARPLTDEEKAKRERERRKYGSHGYADPVQGE